MRRPLLHASKADRLRKLSRLTLGVVAISTALACAAARADAAEAWRSRVARQLHAVHDAPGGSATASASELGPRFDASGRVQVDVHYDCALDAPLGALSAAGLSVGGSIKIPPFCVVEGWIAPAALDQVAAVAGVVRVQVPAYAIRIHPQTPAQTQIQSAPAVSPRAKAQGQGTTIDANGVSIMRADQFVAQTGTNGAGAKVGVQSTGVYSLSIIQARGELPASVQVVNPSGGTSASLQADEGTALLEEVHAVAPGAALVFCGPVTFVDYTSCLQQLINAGATILVDDLIFPPQNLMSDQGSDTQAVTQVLAQNPTVALFTSVGNANGSYWEGPYTPVSVSSLGMQPLSCTSSGTTQIDNYVATFNGSPQQILTVLSGAQFPVALAWADPNASSFDLYWFLNDNNNKPMTQVGCLSGASAAGNLLMQNVPFPPPSTPPSQTPPPQCPVSATCWTYTLYVATPTATPAGSSLLKLWVGGDGLSFLTPSTSGGVTAPQALAPGAITIGAVKGSDGVGNTIEPFSSLGPIQLPLATSTSTQAPILVAPDGINVDAAGTYFASELFPDGNFYGTSASVPNAGGVAALLWGAFPNLTVAQLVMALKTGATQLGPTMPDYTFGYGRIDALGALNAATMGTPPPTMSALSDMTVVGGSTSQGESFTASAFGNVRFSVASSNTALVPAAIVAAGSPGVTLSPSTCGGASPVSCTLTVMPAIGQVGNATLTVSALDGANRAAPASMTVTVTAPAGPSLTINSGASQEFMSGTASTPVSFAVNGTGPLSVTAASSNASLFPPANLTVSAGCGTTTSTCTLGIRAANGASGSATITITVTDKYSQSSSAMASVQVDPGAPSSNASGSSSGGGGGGGGALHWWELVAIALLVSRRKFLRRCFIALPA
jgi:hypothetical protein